MRLVVTSAPADLLPLQLETIGINPEQEHIIRPNGYPCFHWLQTIDGEGELATSSSSWKLTKHTGMLLAPGIPHRYEAKSEHWLTGFITFKGSLPASFIQSFGWSSSERFQWAANDNQIPLHFENLLSFAEASGDPSGWRYSAELYSFLTLLRTVAHTDKQSSIAQRLERMQVLLNWLEKEFANPDIGLAEMAGQLNIGERQLNERFRELFGMPAYTYLIQLRMRKAKEWLPSRPDWTVRRIGEAVGFRDASHFVATFRKTEGMTPHAYRKLYGANIGEELSRHVDRLTDESGRHPEIIP